MADSDKAGSDKAGSKQEGRIIQFNELNLLGKAVFVSGLFTRAATKVVDSTIKATVDIVTEAEKAFKQGIDPNIEEAKILEEHEDKSSKSKKA
ncbi:MAG: hypothetical protein AB8G77_14010 [Rhodothermales bacterium]